MKIEKYFKKPLITYMVMLKPGEKASIAAVCGIQTKPFRLQRRFWTIEPVYERS